MTEGTVLISVTLLEADSSGRASAFGTTDDRSSYAPGHKDLEYGKIKAQRGGKQSTGKFLRREYSLRPLDKIHGITMLEGNAFWRTCRTGREQNISKTLWSNMCAFSRVATDRLCIHVQLDATDIRFREGLTKFIMRHHQFQTGISDDLQEPFPRIRWVKRNVGATGLKNSQYSHQEAHGTIGTEADENVG